MYTQNLLEVACSDEVVGKGTPKLPNHVREPPQTSPNYWLHLQTRDLGEHKHLHHRITPPSDITPYTWHTMSDLVWVLGDEHTELQPQLMLGLPLP